APAFKVSIDAARLDSAALAGTPARSLGTIGTGRTTFVQADFKGRQLIRGHRYVLALGGSYQRSRGASPRLSFLVKTPIVLPPAAPGSASVQQATAAPHVVKGGRFPTRPPSFDNEVNGSRWTVPTGPFVRG